MLLGETPWWLLLLSSLIVNIVRPFSECLAWSCSLVRPISLWSIPCEQLYTISIISIKLTKEITPSQRLTKSNARFWWWNARIECSSNDALNSSKATTSDSASSVVVPAAWFFCLIRRYLSKPIFINFMTSWFISRKLDSSNNFSRFSWIFCASSIEGFKLIRWFSFPPSELQHASVFWTVVNVLGTRATDPGKKYVPAHWWFLLIRLYNLTSSRTHTRAATDDDPYNIACLSSYWDCPSLACFPVGHWNVLGGSQGTIRCGSLLGSICSRYLSFS